MQFYPLKITWGSLMSATNVDSSDAYALFRGFSPEKKAFLKLSLEELAKIDGDINHLEKNALFHINYFGEL